MRDLGLEVGGQVDDVDGIKGTLLGADTATNAQALRDEGDFGTGVDLDAQFARADYGTRLFAFLSTFLGGVRRWHMGRKRTSLTLGLHCYGEGAWLACPKIRVEG